MSTPAPAYLALALQIACQSVRGAASRDASADIMAATIRRIDAAITGAKGFHGELGLVVLPEYFLTGHPTGEPVEQWRAIAGVEFAGPQLDALAVIAARNNVHLAGNVYEADPNFPELYFQASFLIDPSGETVLHYRRLISMYSPSPYDVLDRYLDLYGEEALFPVADTAIGRVAAIASEEILYPEIARNLALRGAEVFVHSSSEAALRGLSPKNLAKQARALENMAYVVSANSAGITGGAMLPNSTDGSSQIVNYEGRVLVETEVGENDTAIKEIDIAALRRARRRVGMGNFLARQPSELFARAYAGVESAHKPNGFLQGEGVQPFAGGQFRERQAGAIEALAKRGLI